MKWLYLLIPLLPLSGAILAGLLGKQLGRAVVHWYTILAVFASLSLSVWSFYHVVWLDAGVAEYTIYTWGTIGSVAAEVGFYIDPLSVMMMLVVTFVSLMVHIYSIGYMRDDPSYQRFFSYISLFTFAMLILVMSDNFIQLFFGWEAVGLVSYLLIGFWFKRPTAVSANLKAFLVNRVGDIGLLMALALIVSNMTGLGHQSPGILSFSYQDVFSHLIHEQLDYSPTMLNFTLSEMLAICLFVAAMGKSAQIPLHIWLPDSMEGPTPISALIHAATMVTAGIFLVARTSPIFEQSGFVLEIIMVVGALTALLMGLVAVVQNDIKRVVAYSTLSQLGYMTVALGASMYSAALFHLMTHAFFKALLFLAAGSVIVAMHHEQDMRKMGGLRRYMPITYWTSLIGALALIGLPPLSGFFSKDLILSAVLTSGQLASESPMPPLINTAYVVYSLLALGVFVTAFYTFRMFFMVFHGDERMDDETLTHLKESPKSITVPLILLAIPTILAGFWIESVGLGSYFGEAFNTGLFNPDHLKQIEAGLREAPAEYMHSTLSNIQYESLLGFIAHGLLSIPVWLALAGVGAAWYLYMKNDELLDNLSDRLRGISRLLENKYYFDEFYQRTVVSPSIYLGNGLWMLGERLLIDGFINSLARSIQRLAQGVRHVQTGYLYHYAFSMVVGIMLMAAWFITQLWS